MGLFLNSNAPYEGYREILRDTYFVDKSYFLNELIPYFEKRNRYCCITRPRRFGKTVMANMVRAFFGKTDRKDGIFDALEISKTQDYRTHLNRHDVIYIDFSKTPKNCKSYEQYIARIQDGIVKDLSEAYADFHLSEDESVWDALQIIYEKTENKFLFVMDEWDAVFHIPFVTAEERREYLLFLKNMLKDQPYVEFAYMTGILPIAKYSGGSELNMFVEYDMVTSEKFSEYFGFSDDEVDRIYKIYQKETTGPKFSRDELRIWYDGYYTAKGIRLYNPRSVVLALTDNQLRNYWTSSGPYDELFYYIRNNVKDVRDDLALMVSGERVAAKTGEFSAISMEINSREQIYSAMVVYGLLTSEKGEVMIPNRELNYCFRNILEMKVDSTPEKAIAQIKEKLNNF